MTNPYVPYDPPGDTTNRTPKMLAGYKSKPVTNGGTPGTNQPPRVIIPPEDLTFRAASRWGLRLNDMPAGPTVYFPYLRRRYNRAAYNQIRIGVDIRDAGNAGSALRVQFTRTPLDDASWVSVGFLGQNCQIALDVAGSWVSNPVQLFSVTSVDDQVEVDVWFRVVGVGGDGTTSPVVGLVYVQLLYGALTPRDRFYWRNIAPSVIPVPTPTSLEQLTTFWGPQGRAYLQPWNSPLPADVLTGARSFSMTKGNNLSVGWSSTVDDDSNNHSGPLFVLVGPPLEAQTIPAFDYRTAFCGVGGSGTAACHLSLQLLLYRPSTEAVIAQSGIGFGGTGWFRYIPKAWVKGLPMDEVACEAGDRFVMYGSTCLELAGGIAASTQGIGTRISYDGGIEITGDVADASSMWINFAAFTDFPELQYQSLTP